MSKIKLLKSHPTINFHELLILFYEISFFFQPFKTPGNLWFSDVSRVYRIKTTGMVRIKLIVFILMGLPPALDLQNGKI